MRKYCKYHPEKEALSFCHTCGEYLCEDCLVEGKDYYYCKRVACQKALQKEIDNYKEVEQSKNSEIPKILIREEVVSFCDKCLAETTSEPYRYSYFLRDYIVFTNEHDPCKICGSVVKDKRFIFLLPFIFIKLSSYRIIENPDFVLRLEDKFISRKIRPIKN